MERDGHRSRRVAAEARMNTSSIRPTLLVLASTYPRWANDHEPGFVHELARRLVSRFRVIVLCPHAAGAAEAQSMDGVEVIRYRYAPEKLEALVNDGGIVANLRRHAWKYLLVPSFVLAQAWHAWHLLRKHDVQVIHAHWLIPQGLLCALLQWLPGPKVPFMVTSHGADLYGLRGPFLQGLKRYVVRRSARTTVVSKAMRGELERIGADIAKVDIEPMGVDLSTRFSPDARVSRSAHEILFVGRLVEKKGLKFLLDAMPSVLRSQPAAHLTVAGFGPEEAALRAQVAALGLKKQVSFIGAVPQAELPALYRRAAVFVAPFVQAPSGDQEGLGLVLVEALGCGCPVVVSDLPATRDVGLAGDGLLRVVPGDFSSLAAGILGMLGTSATESRVSVEYFDWAGRADAYAARLESLITATTDDGHG